MTAVWVPDAAHEAVRDVVRAHASAAADVRKKRQQLLSFLLRHGRIYSGTKHWMKAHARWLANQARRTGAGRNGRKIKLDAAMEALTENGEPDE